MKTLKYRLYNPCKSKLIKGEGVWNEQLCCRLKEVALHPREVHLWFPEGDNCSSTGAILFAKTLNPKVKWIATYSGANADRGYLYDKRQWHTIMTDELQKASSSTL